MDCALLKTTPHILGCFGRKPIGKPIRRLVVAVQSAAFVKGAAPSHRLSGLNGSLLFENVKRKSHPHWNCGGPLRFYPALKNSAKGDARPERGLCGAPTQAHFSPSPGLRQESSKPLEERQSYESSSYSFGEAGRAS